MGVKGYVLKESAMPQINACIKAVSKGRNYISPQLSTFLINRANNVQIVDEKNSLGKMTPTQLRILKLIAEEKVSCQIAVELFISIRTVERHRANLCRKFDLHGTNALVKFAISRKSELR